MLKKLENQPVITMKEARHVVHTDKWFLYVLVEEAPKGRPDWEEKVLILFTADTKDEIRSVSREQLCKLGHPGAGIYWGGKVNPEPGYQIGGIEVDWLPTGN